MPSLLTRVKLKMSIFAHRRARGMLDGEYGSVFKGRSLDFDDLRAYNPGDEVRDIDWKASARHGSPLVKRYVAVRRQTVLLITDTGRNMAASSRGGEDKKDVAVMALGVVGYLAQRHGDAVGLVCGDATGSRSLPAKVGEAHLERLLREVHGSTGLTSPQSRIENQLDYVARNYNQRMLLFVVADEVMPDAETQRLLRRLRAQHEVLWLTLSDAELAGAGGHSTDGYDVADSTLLPGRLAASESVILAYAAAMEQRDAEREAALRRLGIAHVQAGSSHEVMPAVFALLERHRRGK